MSLNLFYLEIHDIYAITLPLSNLYFIENTDLYPIYNIFSENIKCDRFENKHGFSRLAPLDSYIWWYMHLVGKTLE